MGVGEQAENTVTRPLHLSSGTPYSFCYDASLGERLQDGCHVARRLRPASLLLSTGWSQKLCLYTQNITLISTLCRTQSYISAILRLPTSPSSRIVLDLRNLSSHFRHSGVICIQAISALYSHKCRLHYVVDMLSRNLLRTKNSHRTVCEMQLQNGGFVRLCEDETGI